jgi:hypothetical protein
MAVLAFVAVGFQAGNSASSDPACRSDPSSGVHDPGRLSIQSSCAVVTGTIISRNSGPGAESDGDWTFVVQVDSSYQSQFGSNVQAEIVPQDQGSVSPPPLGTHVRLVGPWVSDSNSPTGFQEIHPVWAADPTSCSGCPAASPPGTPTGLSVTGRNGGVNVNWNPPSNNGGSPITEYVITYTPPRASDGHTESFRTSGSSTVDGFANGTSYTFTVSAVNAAGRGSASAPVSVTPFTSSDPPRAVTAQGVNAAAQVSWSPPAFDGGSPITAYAVVASPGGATVSVAGGATQATVTGLNNGTSYTFAVKATNPAGTSPSALSNAVVPKAEPPSPTAPTPRTTAGPGSPGSGPVVSTPQQAADGQGYWLVTPGGAIFPFGAAQSYGSTASLHLNLPIVGMAPTTSGKGYWLVATDGGIFNFGDARFLGSTGAIRLNQPIVGLASTPSGNGYWLVASDGGIFAFGDAPFLGSTGSMRLNQPIVGMASTPSGNGYWLVASDGGIFAYGDARFFGSTGSIRLNKPIVGMAPTKSAGGYWMVASDGGIFNYGDAGFAGSAGSMSGAPVVGMAATRTGGGYWIARSDGQAYAFGDATLKGSLATTGVAGIAGLR